ncbi:MAG: hypothetical protein LLG20_22580 [Acidobacteriales bacterium]|nr:hypothetical protein [Terriglobales bacterium]
MRCAVARPIDRQMAEKCRNLVYSVAKQRKIPPVWITAHVRYPGADEARKEVWRVMIRDFGLCRHQVAEMFGRDLRRVRKTVIGV